MNSFVLRSCAGFVLALCASVPARALVDPGKPSDSRIVEPRLAHGRAASISPNAESTALSPAIRDFALRRGGRWEYFADTRTGLASLVQGEGIPILPGRGNALRADSVAGIPGDVRQLTIAQVLPLTDAFVARERALVAPPRGRLVPSEDGSAVLEDGRLVYVSYDWYLGDVPVEGASVFVRINSGNVVQFGADLVGPISVDEHPALGAEEARKQVFRHGGDVETALEADPPRLVIQPEDDDAGGLAYRLVWIVRYKNFGRAETWEGRVDAHTGAIVGFRDVNAYGRVSGGVYPRTVTDPEVVVPFPLTRVDTGSTQITNTGGRYSYSGAATTTSGLNGTYFNTTCVTCASPAQPLASADDATGRLRFGTGGVDATGNGSSTRADRNAFFHLNQVRRLGKKWLPTHAYFNLNMNAYVNIQDTCNAYFDGNVNFYRSGGGCNNTGEISDVMQHEWGHGLDFYTRSGDGATGEATADVVAMHMTRDARVGPYFGVSGSPVRDLESARSGLITRTNVASFCPGGSGPLGYEVHCEGEIYGQTHWDLAKALVAKHGLHTGWRTSERIFFTSLPNARSYLATGSLPIYSAYIVADDDDGNLANGTPNGGEIYAAFNLHEIAGTAQTSSAGCARPQQPAVSVTSVCDHFTLTWPAVAGATSYKLFRTEILENAAAFPLATLGAGATTWDDLEVAPGTDYWYTVMAVTAGGCESLVESPVHARLAAQPILTVTAAATSDLPRGNRSGYPDPGEEVDLFVSLTNFGEADAAGANGTIAAASAGLTILDATDGWPAIAAGSFAANQGVLRFVTDAGQVTCGSKVKFRLSSIDGGGCAADDSYFEVLIGQDMGGGSVVCDSTPACYAPPTFAGIVSTSPGPSCGEVDLTWASGSTNCQNAQVTYSVYRSTDPGFVPGPVTRVASGIAGNAFRDSILVPGVTYTYVVRADDSRSGQDANLARLSTTGSTAPDTAPPVFNGLATAGGGTGCGEVALTWAQALESCGSPVTYDVYRSTDPAFVPGPSSLVAATTTPSYVDAAVPLGQSFTYVVRARDAYGNIDSNDARRTSGAGALDRLILREAFDATDGGWTAGTPNTATSGLWEWGNPAGTSVQPEDDHTADPGTSCWVTGLAGGGDSANDVDGGYTTIVSPAVDLAATVQPYFRYARWYTDDRGSGPAEDPFETYVSNSGGASWTRVDVVNGGTPLAWVTVEKNITLPRTANMKFRLVARDLLNASLVEAALDDFEIWDRGQGCNGCPAPVPMVGTIRLHRSGADVVLDWTADPIAAQRYGVYALSGPDFSEAIRIGTTSAKTFIHQSAALATEDLAYRITAIDICGAESALH